ncbi:hypothetical protein BVRB_037700, partial [Beta vulgaris subsp. vulgaris]
MAQAESLRFKLLGGLAVRRACNGVLRYCSPFFCYPISSFSHSGPISYVMENGAKGCEIIISGKLQAARAKSMKFKDGYMIKSGEAKNLYTDTATRNIELKQGVLGIKVSIMLPYDPTGTIAPNQTRAHSCSSLQARTVSTFPSPMSSSSTS